MSTVLNDFLSYSIEHANNWSPFSFTLGEHTTVTSNVSGVVTFTPVDRGPEQRHIVLSSGVHGNETAPMEICNKMISDIADGSLLVSHRVMFIFGNLPAIALQTRFIEENLNRLFAPDVSGMSAEVPRAKVLMHAVSDFFADAKGERHHYDLHTAIRASKNEKFAVYPYLHGLPYSKLELQFMSDCGVNTILLSQSSTATFSYYSSRYHNAHTFTVELGKVKPFGENDMARFASADNMFRRLLQEPVLNLTPYNECPLQLYEVNQVVDKHHEDFALHFSDDTANFTDFPKGTLLASESGQEYRAQVDGEAIVFPNADVAIGQRAMLTVVPCEL
ncbi:succinylglutamate desuccinylase [Glaciecola sp. SC05]|uniref:succinylglutamate desuccinylase n=1 Tax=Glaciecola sp. SC05 TaxID=1987355 RepID=UPI0035274CAA